jgi:glycosyltransferase involved in cell wall biosynthesis
MDKKLIIFISNPNRPEKNFNLAREAVKMMNKSDVELMPVYNVPNEEICYYLNAADILLLTSKWEGSVNVIKEAMACNSPIVVTDVGDVCWVIGNTQGCFISTFEPEDVADKTKLALQFSKKMGRTKGRERIIELGLDSKIYNSVIEKRGIN